ncbi:MAG: AbrB/MazE/SpoVT family DNA-binding domain-containing protein [Zavarzinia sp.]|nr:AbrB/MazE/SpoVT family DNA-binding domain-containing protein [Zavarzinia sp.]
MRTPRLGKVGNSTGITVPRSTGITVPREVLEEANMSRGDEVTLTVRDGRIEIAKAHDGYNKAMEAGRAFAARYRRTMAVLAK